MPRKPQPERDAAIHKALAEKQPAAAVAQNYGLTVSSVYRAAERFAAVQTQGTPAAMPVRSLAGGPNFSGDARTGLRRFGGLIVDDYDRQFQTVYKRTQLYREMGDDPVVAAVLQACKMTLRRATIYAETDGESEADLLARDFLDEAWGDMAQSGTDTIDQASNMLQYGFYPAEIVYKKRNGPQMDRPNLEPGAPSGRPSSKYDDGRIGWRKWTFMAPETLAPGREWIFDETGGLQGLNQLAPPDYKFVTIPIQKMILFRTTAEKGNPEGRSLLRAMHRAWYYKNNLEEVEAISAERMGAGLPVVYLGNGTARAGAAGDDLDVFKDIIRNIRIDDQMGVVIPYQKQDPATGNGVLLELMSPPSRGAIDFNQVISRHEQRLAMVGLAQFVHLGLSGSGSRALGESMMDFFNLAVSAWVDSIVDTINRYAVERLFSLNYFPGLTTLPKLAHEAIVETDIAKVAGYINLLVGAQVITPTEDLERYLLELADMPQANDLGDMWKQKQEQKSAMQDLALKGGQMALDQGIAPAVGGKPAVKPGTPPAERAGDEMDRELLNEIRLARHALELSEQAERFAVREQQPAQQPNITVENRFENVTMPENFTDAMRQPAPQVTVNVPEQPAPQVTVNMPDQPAPVVNVAAPIVNIPAPIVNLPEHFGEVMAPAPIVTVRAELIMPDTETTTDIELDKQTQRIKRTRATTRKVK